MKCQIESKMKIRQEYKTYDLKASSYSEDNKGHSDNYMVYNLQDKFVFVHQIIFSPCIYSENMADLRFVYT